MRTGYSLMPWIGALVFAGAALAAVFSVTLIYGLLCSQGDCGGKNTTQMIPALAGLFPAFMTLRSGQAGDKSHFRSWLLLTVAIYLGWGLLADAATDGDWIWNDPPSWL